MRLDVRVLIEMDEMDEPVSCSGQVNRSHIRAEISASTSLLSRLQSSTTTINILDKDVTDNLRHVLPVCVCVYFLHSCDIMLN